MQALKKFQIRSNSTYKISYFTSLFRLFRSRLELQGTTQATLEATVREQLLPDTVVDPTRC